MEAKMEQTYHNTAKEMKKRTIPKNIRQIGRIEDGLKIYVEDYVKTYMKQLSEEELSENPVAVLVGEYQRTEEGRCVFIYGAIRAEQIWEEDTIVFTEDTWTTIYETIKRYFPEAEIAGWFVCGNDFRGDRAEMLKNTHLDNFAGKDKLLYIYDITEKEEQFYKYEEGTMVTISGYFIYYEKNEEMQGYLIDHKPSKREEIAKEDRAVREFRSHTSIWQEQTNAKSNNKKKKAEGNMAVRRMVYLAGSMLTLVVLAIGMTALRNQEKMKGLEETIHTMKTLFQKEETPKENQDNIFKEGQTIQGGNLTASELDNEKESIETSAPEQKEEGKDNLLQTGDKNGKNQKEETNPTDAPDQTEDLDQTDETSGEKNETSEPVPTDVPKEENAKDTSTSPLTGDDVFIYTVKQGDTLAGICYKLYGTTEKLEFIKTMNQIINEDKIYVGQELVVPNME